jgi:uncharacterized repeat protein (TIGR04138 family)
MSDASFKKTVAEICARDTRYAADGYYFLCEALDYTVKALKKPPEGVERHVSGKELAEGIRDYALQEFGPLALTVLRTWGIQRTEDFGELVFHLVEAGKLGKTEKDTRADFAHVYDFDEVFARPFEAEPAPSHVRRTRRPKPGAR